ncbi:hypothetical protein MNBD_GAMMA02-1318 [hydrothermal vent metagenome]|uniref:Uncharacterized protein n=1 Tax=hydrothermal vent metagenome TaxID=652676 RepID=A0A3B0WRV1_9ZZZZ
MTLSNLYYSNKFLIPQDNVLQYFYLALAEKQNNNNPISAGFNSDESYDMLNDQEKQHADRMTKQLK